jgi:phosphohistidine phosphatase
MRRLLLLRHGKSAGPPGVDDLDRPLARGGREAARRMGHYLADEDLRPDLALVSPARRTEETWNLARESLGPVPARSEPRIYEAPPDQLLAVVNGVEPEVGTLLVVGHNPGLEELLQLLIPLQDRYGHGGAITSYPTAALAVINVPAMDWDGVSPRSARLDRFVTPRSLGLDEAE